MDEGRRESRARAAPPTARVNAVRKLWFGGRRGGIEWFAGLSSIFISSSLESADMGRARERINRERFGSSMELNFRLRARWQHRKSGRRPKLLDLRNFPSSSPSPSFFALKLKHVVQEKRSSYAV